MGTSIDAADESGAEIVDGAGQGIVVHDAEGLRAGGDAHEHFADAAGFHRMILVHERDRRALDFSAEGISQHDELDQREHHRCHHERGAAEEFSQVAFDERRDAIELHFNWLSIHCRCSCRTPRMA